MTYDEQHVYIPSQNGHPGVVFGAYAYGGVLKYVDDVVVNAVDDVVGSNVVDDVDGSNVVDDVDGSNVVDDVDGSNVVDDVVGSNVVDDVDGSNVVDNVVGSDVVDDSVVVGTDFVDVVLDFVDVVDRHDCCFMPVHTVSTAHKTTTSLVILTSSVILKHININ